MSEEFSFEWNVTKPVIVCVLMNPESDDPTDGDTTNPCGNDSKWMVRPLRAGDFLPGFSFDKVSENDKFWVGIYPFYLTGFSATPPLLRQFWWHPEKGSTGVRITYDVVSDLLTTKSVFGVDGPVVRKSNWWVYLIVIGMIMLLGAGAFLFFMRRRRR